MKQLEVSEAIKVENIINQLVCYQELLSTKEEYVVFWGDNNEKLAPVNLIARDLKQAYSTKEKVLGKKDYTLFKDPSSLNNFQVKIDDLIHFLKEEVSFYEKIKRKISLLGSKKELESLREEIDIRLDSFIERAEKDLSN